MPFSSPRPRLFAALSSGMAAAGLLACGEKATVAAVQAPLVTPAGFEEGVVSLEGTITLKGAPRTPDTVVDSSSDPYCRSHGAITSEKWTVSGEGGLANAVVTVLDAPATASSASPAPIEQSGCRYTPAVSVMSVTQAVDIRNDDDTFHNVRVVQHQQGTADKGKNVANYMQPGKGIVTTHRFSEPGPYRLECDVHRWMRAWVFVAPNNHVALSQAGGRFQLNRGLKDGTYTVQAWHAQFAQPITKSVQVVAGRARVDFEFDATLALN